MVRFNSIVNLSLSIIIILRIHNIAMGNGVSGAANGLAGLFGFGSFWNPVDSSGLTQAQSALQATQDYWNARLAACKGQLQEAQQTFLEQKIEATKTQQQVVDELLTERVTSNTLLIAMLVFLVFFLIIYTLY